LTFVVEITDLALAEAADYVHFIREVKKEPQSAEEWFRALLAAIFSLEEQPEDARSLLSVMILVSRFAI
jgi:hypothetical protein